MKVPLLDLKAQYAALCDNQYDSGGIAALFTEDAVWEGVGAYYDNLKLTANQP